MSESVSTRTKTLSDSRDSVSTEGPLVADRWSNNISYRQLVISSCIGILQLWWHPYLYDLQKLLPFIFLYNLFSVIVGYPMFYLELALGVVTKKSVLRCWDLAPIARGVGFAMLACCIFTALALGAVSAWCLALFVHSFHSFLPWLHCAAAARPACSARHRPLDESSETPAQSFFFNFVLDLKRNGLEGGLGNIVWELGIYYIISWVLIYLIAVKRIYSYSKLVLFKDVLAYFVLVCFGLGAFRLHGSTTMFQVCDWTVLLNNMQIWRDAVEYSLIQMTVSQGCLVMLGSYCPKQQHKLGTTALLAFAASKTSSMLSAFILGAAHGALLKDFDVNNTNLMAGPSSTMVMWSDYVARIPGSQFWSGLFFFAMFVLAISSTALLVQTIMSTLTGHSIRKIYWAFLIFICFLFGLIGIITLCTQGGLYILNFLMEWPVAKPRTLGAGMAAVVVTYMFGQTTFCEDVYFAVGEYPGVFMRVCWALTPIFLIGMFVASMCAGGAAARAGALLVALALLPAALIMLFYLVFKCRVRNIVGNEK
ncbi:hypothetical protein ABMA27_004252 [Loxostege sticticalis]|uniref:Sodium-dependent nutrient amino acid transporter 1 n=1 Tax=Loxostege sticticalis TaxID=481309 RepID=A0ABR3HMW9_LOXSC